MSKKAVLWLTVLSVLVPLAVTAQAGDPYTLQVIGAANGVLKAQWMDMRVEQVTVLTVGQAKATTRLHSQGYGWVPNDSRRAADGTNLTYLISGDRGSPSNAGFSAGQAEEAVDRAVATWGGDSCLKQLQLEKRPYTGADVTIFDAQLGFGGQGNWRAADVVLGGFMPPAFFDAVVPDGGKSVLALSVTFVFIGADGQPTDIDGDGHLDTAASEIYFNDGFSWTVNGGTGFDVQTVALHELGHSLELGHFVPPPAAVMNPVYAGPRPALMQVDHAALCSAWGAWPH
ncbi:MAG TPA: matrixin family metalloprotease [Thermoanaerobaculia bacterium]|jgi:hypothetical protein|nr:matrixin family metalloprotease [Thermoanaerobaculia bacterium]